MTVFTGSKGGGGKAPEVVRTPDNLRANDQVEAILGLGEGRWAGLVEGEKSFFIGDTALVNQNGSKNFTDFTLEFHDGDRVDAPEIKSKMGGFSRSTNVTTEMKKDIPIVRTTQSGDIDFIEIRLAIQQLYAQTEAGTFNNSFRFTIRYKPFSAANWLVPFTKTEWINATGLVTSAVDQASGLSVTLRQSTPVGPNTPTDIELRARYRAVGSTDWVLLGEYEGVHSGNGGWVTVTRTVERMAGEGQGDFYTYSEQVYRTSATTIERQFRIEGLTPGQYEVEVSSGQLVLFQYERAVPILSVSGKTTSTTPMEWRFPVNRIAEPYEIEMLILDETDTVSSFISVQWESFQEVVAQSFQWPGTVVAHLTARANNQFSSIPDFWGVYNGTICNIPSNYDPVARTYDGIWDGTYIKEFTNNPAWCLLDYVESDEYGVNAYWPMTMNKWDVYEAAQWCDEGVPDGKGGLQPRFTMNVLISEPRSTNEQAKFMAGMFHGSFWDNLDGTVGLKVEKNEPASHLFAPENIIGDFEYSYTDITSRYNDITVVHVNPELNWSEDRRRVFSQELIDKNGRVPFDFIAVGCTNTREAQRRAYVKLLTANTEITMVTFRVNRLGAFVNPFDTALIADPDQGWGISGRFKTIKADRTGVTLRDPIYVEQGVSYTLHVYTPDGVLERPLIGLPINQSTSELNFTEALPDGLPEARLTFDISDDGTTHGASKPFRVLSVEEVDGNPDLFQILAMEINRNMWSDADNLTDSGTINYTSLSSAQVVPGPNHVDMYEIFRPNELLWHLYVEPVLDRSVFKYYSGEYEVWSRLLGTNDAYERRDLTAGAYIAGHPPGYYEFKILPKTYLGTVAELSRVQAFPFNVVNPLDPPDNIPPETVVVTYSVDAASVRWGEVRSVDLKGYRVIQGSSLADGFILHDAYQGNELAIPFISKDPIRIFIQPIDYFGVGASIPIQLDLTPIRPANVPRFLVVQQGDEIMAQWTEVEGSNLVYEIREGFSFELGNLVAVGGGDRLLQLFPNTGPRNFWIKAKSRSGLYSETARLFTTSIAPQMDRNVVVERDLRSKNWPGVWHYSTVNGDGHMVVDQTVEGAANSRAFGYVPVTLAAEYSARNWIDPDLFASASDGVTWEQADFTWLDPEANATWIGIGADIGGATTQAFISISKSLGAEYKHAFSFDNTLTGLLATVPNLAAGVSYAPVWMRDGLRVSDLTRVGYNIVVENTFSLTFHALLEAAPVSDLIFLSLESPSGTLVLGYDFLSGAFYLTDGSNRLEVSISFSQPDVLMFGVVQTATTRRLMVGSIRKGTSDQMEAILAPISGIDELRLYPS